MFVINKKNTKKLQVVPAEQQVVVVAPVVAAVAVAAGHHRAVAGPGCPTGHYPTLWSAPPQLARFVAEI